MEKGFFDVFSRYTPAEDKRALLERGHSAKFRYTKAPMRVEVELDFDKHEDPELIYEIEDECRELYGAESFKILPHFPESEFNIGRFGEIASEAALCGAVTNGFFSGAEFSDNGDVITVAIPYAEGGIDFVKGAGTENILSNILKSRYGVSRKINIIKSAAAEARAREIEVRRAEKIEMAERENRMRIREEMQAAIAKAIQESKQ